MSDRPETKGRASCNRVTSAPMWNGGAPSLHGRGSSIAYVRAVTFGRALHPAIRKFAAVTSSFAVVAAGAGCGAQSPQRPSPSADLPTESGQTPAALASRDDYPNAAAATRSHTRSGGRTAGTTRPPSGLRYWSSRTSTSISTCVRPAAQRPPRNWKPLWTPSCGRRNPATRQPGRPSPTGSGSAAPPITRFAAEYMRPRNG